MPTGTPAPGVAPADADMSWREGGGGKIVEQEELVMIPVAEFRTRSTDVDRFTATDTPGVPQCM